MICVKYHINGIIASVAGAQLSLVEDPIQHKSLCNMITMDRYPFTYDGVDDTDPTRPSHKFFSLGD